MPTVTLSTVAFCSYSSLRGLRLATLNWARMRILLRGYMQNGGAAVPGPREVNAREPMPSWLLGRRANAREWTMPVRYGAPLNQTAPTAAALRRLAELYVGERYLLSIAPGDDVIAADDGHKSGRRGFAAQDGHQRVRGGGCDGTGCAHGHAASSAPAGTCTLCARMTHPCVQAAAAR